jgi:ubiquitin-protein ligase
MSASKRIIKELREFKLYINSESIDNHRLISTNCVEDNLMLFNVYFLGPKDSPYEELLNNILIEIPLEYPIKAPSMKFINKIFHPNISTDGVICLDILKDKWSPVYTIRTIIMSIISLLSDPNPDSPLNGNAARLYKESLLSKKSKREYVKMILSNDV